MSAMDNADRMDEIQEQGALGLRLRDAREYLGLSQEFVAQQLGVPRASVSAMETGKRKVSSLELKKLTHLYRRPLSYFLDEAEQPSTVPDATSRALFRATRDLSEADRQQVLRFAQFLRGSGEAPTSTEKDAEEQHR